MIAGITLRLVLFPQQEPNNTTQTKAMEVSCWIGMVRRQRKNRIIILQIIF